MFIGQKRCSPCSDEIGTRKAKKTTTACYKCEKPVCKTHYVAICDVCAQDTEYSSVETDYSGVEN